MNLADVLSSSNFLYCNYLSDPNISVSMFIKSKTYPKFTEEITGKRGEG